MFKTNLKKFREEKGLSQLQLSVKTEIAPGTISNLESGKIFAYPGWKKRISEALEISESELFPENESEVR